MLHETFAIILEPIRSRKKCISALPLTIIILAHCDTVGGRTRRQSWSGNLLDQEEIVVRATEIHLL